MPDRDEDTNVITRPKPKQETALPKMWAILFVNDDYTPMEFVVYVLVEVLRVDLDSATRLMLKVHKDGAAKVGRFTRDVAETKVAQIGALAKLNEHPLNVQAVEAD